MNIKVGVLGAKDTVDLMMDIAKANYNDLSFSYFTYNNHADISEILSKHRSMIDVWIFSGQVPYAIAKEANLIDNNAFHLELNGSSLFKTFLEMTYTDHLKLERISFDTIAENAIFETLGELNLPLEDIYINSYKGYKSPQELIDFHFSLYQQNKVRICVTCIRSVYEELKKRNVPVYRIIPTRVAIHQAIRRSRQQGETLHFKRSQIAVQIIQVEDMNNIISENTFSYEVYRLDLKLQEAILEYSEAIFGSLLPLGRGNFIIFSTRGLLEDSTVYHPNTLLDNLRLITDQPVNIGIGYGQNALAAEQNARLGLTHAKNQGGNRVVLVDEYGYMEGPLKRPQSIGFRFRTEDKDISEKLTKAGINISTFNKFLAIQDKIGPVSSVNISELLGMTPRNARRILSNLEQHGMAEIVGEEAPTGKGRPRKIYKIGIYS
jgi:hypothetical protein